MVETCSSYYSLMPWAQSHSYDFSLYMCLHVKNSSCFPSQRPRGFFKLSSIPENKDGVLYGVVVKLLPAGRFLWGDFCKALGEVLDFECAED